jgi:hypothetical protein
LVKTREQLCGFLRDRRSDRGGNLVYLAMKALGHKQRPAELPHPRQVELPESSHPEDAFEESVLSLPRLENAEVLTLLLRPHQRELTKRMIQVLGS